MKPLTSLAALMFFLGATPALAGVADPSQSIVDSFVVVCPAGDIEFHVLARDFAGIPEGDHECAFELCCPGVTLCSPLPSDRYAVIAGCTLEMTNDPEYGAAFYRARAGGVCSNATLRVLWGGVLLRTLTAIASPDQNGDLTVDGTDRAILEARIAGAFDPAADLDGNDALDAADLAVFETHLGHGCDPATPARRGTWGRVKTLYR